MKYVKQGKEGGYIQLAYAVLEQVAYDYYELRRKGYKGERVLDNIAPVWFALTGVNKEWFINTLIKEGDRKYGDE